MINVLVLSQQSPFDDMHIRDALDMTLIFAAIEQNISWLFTGPAVLALKKDQNSELLGVKNYFKSIKTLEVYDVENIYVCEKSLIDYNLDINELIIKATALDFKAQSHLIAKQQQVVNL